VSISDSLAGYRNYSTKGEKEKYLPLRCPSCGDTLDQVEWHVDSTYSFNPVTGGYDEEKDGRGTGSVVCPHCKYELNDGEGGPFDEGPDNAGVPDGRMCATCAHILRDESGEPLWNQELEEYSCYAQGGYNGQANWIHMSRGHQECNSHTPWIAPGGVLIDE